MFSYKLPDKAHAIFPQTNVFSGLFSGFAVMITNVWIMMINM